MCSHFYLLDKTAFRLGLKAGAEAGAKVVHLLKGYPRK